MRDDRARRHRRLWVRRPGERRLRLQRPVHQQWPVAAQPGRDRDPAGHPDPGGAWAVDGDPGRGAVRHRGRWGSAAVDRCLGWVLCAGGGLAWAVGRRPADRGVADAGVHRHSGAMAAAPPRSAFGDPGPGAPVHRLVLGDSSPGRRDRAAGPAWTLAYGSPPGPTASLAAVAPVSAEEKVHEGDWAGAGCGVGDRRHGPWMAASSVAGRHPDDRLGTARRRRPGTWPDSAPRSPSPPPTPPAGRDRGHDCDRHRRGHRDRPRPGNAEALAPGRSGCR